MNNIIKKSTPEMVEASRKVFERSKSFVYNRSLSRRESQNSARLDTTSYDTEAERQIAQLCDQILEKSASSEP